ncbi:hypothetical protein HanPI659440_Chr13g0522341 [Helianthus annuus]|nr:hypothetical protein HanPI659440_Chr13g0522341 [Helianthus annuus]
MTKIVKQLSSPLVKTKLRPTRTGFGHFRFGLLIFNLYLEFSVFNMWVDFMIIMDMKQDNQYVLFLFYILSEPNVQFAIYMTLM